MNQAEVHRLVKALKFKVQPKPFKIGGEFGGTYRYVHLLTSVIMQIIESSSLQNCPPCSKIMHVISGLASDTSLRSTDKLSLHLLSMKGLK